MPFVVYAAAPPRKPRLQNVDDLVSVAKAAKDVVIPGDVITTDAQWMRSVRDWARSGGAELLSFV